RAAVGVFGAREHAARGDAARRDAEVAEADGHAVEAGLLHERVERVRHGAPLRAAAVDRVGHRAALIELDVHVERDLRGLDGRARARGRVDGRADGAVATAAA